MSIRLKVIMPKWWTGGAVVYGWTDAIDTYCCDTRPAWFVDVPEYEYQGYFQVSDLAKA